MHLVPVRGPADVSVVRVAGPGPASADAGASSGPAGRPTDPDGTGQWPDVAADSTELDRWVFDDTNGWYPAALAGGVRLARGHDLRLARTVLRHSPLTAATALATRPPDEWDTLRRVPAAGGDPSTQAPEALFEIVGPEPDRPALDPVAELRRQLAAVEHSTDPGRLRLLLAAESAGALAAAEIHHAGLPWRADVHDRLLAEILGPRPRVGERPARMEELAAQVRAALDAPALNLDSPPALLKALQYAGLAIRSTSKWELRGLDHPVVEPLLEYKRLARLLTANGWTWLDSWVRDGRFRPEYVVGGVVTGRWATDGGGALQLPHSIRGAVIADPGWVLIVADAAQLEPRVLAGMARDERMAAAGRDRDLYDGIVADGVVESRAHAKVGMLGAMYGGTTGDSALVLPRLARAFPAAIALVEAAARAGERGEAVVTRLGRGSPRPDSGSDETQAGAYAADADADAQSRARSQTRAWGRFTRNFIVQGTAAEWALCWIACLRRDLWKLGEAAAAGLAPEPFARRPHLVFFLHDEVIVHAPAELADAVAEIVREAAREAGRLLFADFPVDFPLTVAAVDDYGSAKG